MEAYSSELSDDELMQAASEGGTFSFLDKPEEEFETHNQPPESTYAVPVDRFPPVPLPKP